MIYAPKSPDPLPTKLGDLNMTRREGKVEEEPKKEEPAPVKHIWSALLEDQWWTWMSVKPSSAVQALAEIVYKFEEGKWIAQPVYEGQGSNLVPPDMSKHTLTTASDLDDLAMSVFRKQSVEQAHDELLDNEYEEAPKIKPTKKEELKRIARTGWLIYCKDWGYLDNRTGLPLGVKHEAEVIFRVQTLEDGTYRVLQIKNRANVPFSYDIPRPFALTFRGGRLFVKRVYAGSGLDSEERFSGITPQ